MNIEEAVKILKNEIDYICEDKDVAIETLLTAYEKEKEKNKEIEEEIEELKRKERLIKTYKGNLPEDVEFICLCKSDFERNISDDYISKDKIKAKIEEVEQWKLYNMKIPRLSTLDERLGAKIGIKYVLQSLLEKE